VLVERVVEVRLLAVRMQTFQTPAACGSGPRGSGTNAKFSKAMPRVVVVRTQNFQSEAARGSGTRGSCKNVKFSKSSRAWYWSAC